MIPSSYIQAWSTKAPWPDARQIEQDLIISRALCDLFNAPMLKLKVEINTREHEHLLGIKPYPFAVESDWYQGETEIASFEREALFGTKLCALLQRRKNRDLFDLNEGLKQLKMDPAKLVQCLDHYLALEGATIGRAAAERRFEDVAPMLPAGITFSDDEAIAAVGRVWTELVTRLHGESWKLSGEYIEAVRAGRYPGFLR